VHWSCAKRLKNDFEAIFTGSKVTGIEAQDDGLHVSFEGGKAPASDTFDRVLLAVGRSPNGKKINAEAAGVAVDERGFIAADSQQRTNVAHIYAIGDIVGQPMLAHKATHEGKVAAENASGEKSWFDPKTRLLGAGIVGPNAGELIAEAVLALEMGADIEDMALTVHPHPTLSETLNFAAEVAEGTCTDIYAPKKKR